MDGAVRQCSEPIQQVCDDLIPPRLIISLRISDTNALLNGRTLFINRYCSQSSPLRDEIHSLDISTRERVLMLYANHHHKRLSNTYRKLTITCSRLSKIIQILQPYRKTSPYQKRWTFLLTTSSKGIATPFKFVINASKALLANL